MDALGPVAVFAMYVFGLALVAAAGLVDCLSDNPRGARLRAMAALSAGAIVPVAIVWAALCSVGMGAGGAWLAVVGAIPLVASRFFSWSQKHGGVAHRVAAWPFWSVAVCLSGVLVAGGEVVTALLLLLVPALVVGVCGMELTRAAFRPAPARTNAEVLAFLAPTHGLPTCAVCAEAVRNRKLTCPQCRAVQHRECWEFNGSCGACSSQRLA